jgi:hypothetical protein
MSIFLDETKRLLKTRPKHITFQLISEETGLTIDWIESLLYRKEKPGKLFDPGVRRIEKLYNYLAEKPFSFANEEIKETIFNLD